LIEVDAREEPARDPLAERALQGSGGGLVVGVSGALVERVERRGQCAAMDDVGIACAAGSSSARRRARGDAFEEPALQGRPE
jgi:hypothetical protein